MPSRLETGKRLEGMNCDQLQSHRNPIRSAFGTLDP
jgi:hypothetical protein